MKVLLSLFAFLICNGAAAVDLFDGAQPRPFSLADRLASDVTIGGYPIWQAEGKWRIANISQYSSGGSAMPVPLGVLDVFQTDEKKFVAVMRVTANLAQATAGDWTDSPCKRDDMLFKATIGGSFANVNCVTINHVAGFPGNPSGKAAELFSLFKEQGVEVPPTVIQVAFTRYTNNLRRLQVLLYVNPELAGFARDSEPLWGRNSWHKSQSASDADKRRFIGTLSEWALRFGKQMDFAFDKKADAFTGVESWRSVYAMKQQAIPVATRISLD